MFVLIKKCFKSFRYAFSGLKYLIEHENNARVHLVATIAAIIFSIVLKISPNEWVLIIFSIFLVWFAELINSSIERVVDLISPQYHEMAKRSKDYAAAAVLVISLAALVTGCIIFLPKIYRIFYCIMEHIS